MANVKCEQCGGPTDVEQQVFDKVKPQHIFCSVECRTIWIKEEPYNKVSGKFRAGVRLTPEEHDILLAGRPR